MAKINTGRVVVGGLLAGLIIDIVEGLMNTVVLADQMQAQMAAHNLPEFGGSAIAIMNLWCFALGIATVWLYAAIRPRFGAGPRTAVIAGVFMWLIAYVAPGIPQMLMGIFSPNLFLASFAYGLVEMVVAALVGARLYREESRRPEPIASAMRAA